VKRVRVSGYARVTRKPSGAIVVTKVKPYRRQPPKQEETMSTDDRTPEPLDLGTRLALQLDETTNDNVRLREENAHLRAALHRMLDLGHAMSWGWFMREAEDGLRFPPSRDDQRA
jgi:hypothetical protein